LGVIRGRFLSMIVLIYLFIETSWGLRWSAPLLIRWPSWILFPSIISQTPGSIDLIFLWHIVCDERTVPFDDHPRWPVWTPSWSWFPSIIWQTPGLTGPILCSLLEVTEGMFLSIISSAAHPRWPLRQPSWIWFPWIIWQTPGSTGPIFLWLIGGDWRKLLFDDQLHRSSKMAVTAAMLAFVSVDYLTNTWVNWSDIFVACWGDWRKVTFDDQLHRSFKIAATAAIMDLVSVDYPLTNAWVDWSDFLVAYWGWLEEGSCRWPAPPLPWRPSWIWFPSIFSQSSVQLTNLPQ
jgi:hypothetical protein